VTHLGELITIIKGRKAPEAFDKPQENTRRYIQIDDLRPGSTVKYARDRNGILATKTDVLIAWDGANAGTVGFGLEGYVGSTISILRRKDESIYPPLLGYFLRSKFGYLQAHTTGATIPHVSRDALESLELGRPPLPEQKRIVAILDKADRLRHLRRYSLQLSDTYLQSVFLQMFGDPSTNPKDWPVEPIQRYISFMTSGSRGWAAYYSQKGAIFLRIQNIGRNQLLLDDLTYVQPPANTEGQRTRVQVGDLLLSITADLGRTAVIPENFPTAYINQHLALLRLEGINPVFAAGALNSPGGKAQISRLDREGVKSGLNFDDVRGLKITTPPLSLQEQYARIVQKHERLRAQQREAERQAEHLFQILLHKAFTGELTASSTAGAESNAQKDNTASQPHRTVPVELPSLVEQARLPLD
jgi:type I restriction enzyme, S subunit